MSWPLRYEGNLTADAAEAVLRAALPHVEFVRKTGTVFVVAAPPDRSAVPAGWVLYQPAVLDTAPPPLLNARTRAAFEAARAGRPTSVDHDDL